MSNRYGHHQKCVLAHISIDVKRSGPKGVDRLHSKDDGGCRWRWPMAALLRRGNIRGFS